MRPGRRRRCRRPHRQPTPAPSSGSGAGGAAPGPADVGRRLDELKRLAADTADHVVMLIVVFLLQTLVLPVLTLWALLGAARQALLRGAP